MDVQEIVTVEGFADSLDHSSLPGNMDTNAARNAVADKYQRELTVTCVVAPAERASSDKREENSCPHVLTLILINGMPQRPKTCSERSRKETCSWTGTTIARISALWFQRATTICKLIDILNGTQN